MIIIYLQSLIMIRENTGPTKVLLPEPLLTVMILGMGNPLLDRRSYFFIQNDTIFFQFQPENAKWILRRKLSKLLMLGDRNSRRVSQA